MHPKPKKTPGLPARAKRCLQRKKMWNCKKLSFFSLPQCSSLKQRMEWWKNPWTTSSKRKIDQNIRFKTSGTEHNDKSSLFNQSLRRPLALWRCNNEKKTKQSQREVQLSRFYRARTLWTVVNQWDPSSANPSSLFRFSNGARAWRGKSNQLSIQLLQLAAKLESSRLKPPTSLTFSQPMLPANLVR